MYLAPQAPKAAIPGGVLLEGGRASPAPPPKTRFLGISKKSDKRTPELAPQTPASHLQSHAATVSAVSLVSTISALIVVGRGVETGSPPDGSPEPCTHEDSTIPSISPTLEGKNMKDSSNPSQDTTSGSGQTNSDPASGTENPSQERLAAIWEKTLAIANQKLIDNNLPPLDLENLKSQQSAEENMQSVIRLHVPRIRQHKEENYRGRALGKNPERSTKICTDCGYSNTTQPGGHRLSVGWREGHSSGAYVFLGLSGNALIYILDRSLLIIWKPLNVLKQQR